MHFHHISIKCSDIHRSIDFYEKLGFVVNERFTAGTTLACWLTGNGMRLELLQVPTPHPPPDPFLDEHFVGYYHLSFLVENLQDTLYQLLNQLGELKMPLSPHPQAIANQQYQIAFIRDPDNLPIELLQINSINPKPPVP